LWIFYTHFYQPYHKLKLNKKNRLNHCGIFEQSIVEFNNNYLAYITKSCSFLLRSVV